MSESRKNKIKLPNRVKINKPKFLRLESWRYKRIKTGWRWPRGSRSRMRKKKKGWPKLPSAGFGTKKIFRGIHPSGFREVLVYGQDDLNKINPKEEAIRIASGIGEKKRLTIVEIATNMNLKILNLSSIEEKSGISESENSEIPKKDSKENLDGAEIEEKLEKSDST
jgi:large subunit ribosomal protein L32e